ncbi:hypothetical protein IFM89_011398 [Coptis chinensis]|uniref:PUB 62/63 C-terminal domain-containing protein n=1 Tax=Coptis chinensis TaxID=261450 RepID=A0A835I299_9MAGN|nr:hypothetical protein IFM89_011398 [Coptis chinensis]
MTLYFASGQSSRPYIGSPSYHQPVTYNYQQGFAYPQYGYPFCSSGILLGKRVKFLSSIKEKKRKGKSSRGDLSIYFSRGKGVQFPFAVTDRLVIKGNKRTPLCFVGREDVVTTQCLNGWFLYPIYLLICVAATAVIESFLDFSQDKYAPNLTSLTMTVLKPVVLGLILVASHYRTFSLIHGYSAPLEAYKHLEHHEDVGVG